MKVKVLSMFFRINIIHNLSTSKGKKIIDSLHFSGSLSLRFRQTECRPSAQAQTKGSDDRTFEARARPPPVLPTPEAAPGGSRPRGEPRCSGFRIRASNWLAIKHIKVLYVSLLEGKIGFHWA